MADRRAETPTAAAEMAVPDLRDILKKLEKSRDDLSVQLRNKIRIHKMYIDRIVSDMDADIHRRLNEYRYQLDKYKLILEENNPANILSKGYTILETDDGKVISSAEDFIPGRSYKLNFKDGSVIFTYNIQ